MGGTASGFNKCSLAGGGNVYTLSACMHACLSTQPQPQPSNTLALSTKQLKGRGLELDNTPTSDRQSPAFPHTPALLHTQANRILESAGRVATRTSHRAGMQHLLFPVQTNPNNQQPLTDGLHSIKSESTEKAVQVQAITTTLTHLTGQPSQRRCTQVNVGIIGYRAC